MSRSVLKVRYAIRRKSPYETESCAVQDETGIDRDETDGDGSYVIECAELQRVQVIGSS
jgi:hypothetical protein